MPRMGRPKVDDLREFRVNLRLSTEEKALLEAYAEKYHLKKEFYSAKGSFAGKLFVNNHRELKWSIDSIISAEYSMGNGPIGTIGLIGPRRINYSKVIAIMAQVMKELNDTLKNQRL